MISPALHASAFPPVGRWLKARRDVLGYSLSESSDHVQMSETTLQLLESESFMELPEPAFAKSYLRRYAKHLSLNPDEVSTLFDAWMQLHDQTHSGTANAARSLAPRLKSASHHPAKVQPMRKLQDYLGSALHSQAGHAAVIAVCLGLFSFFLSNGSDLTSSRIAENANVPASSTMASLPPEPARLMTQAAPEHGADIQPAAPLHSAVPTRGTVIKQTRQATAAGHWLIASETTHVHVTDHRGLIVFSGLVKSGQPVALKGKAPFHIDSAKDGTISLRHGGDSQGRQLDIAAL